MTEKKFQIIDDERYEMCNGCKSYKKTTWKRLKDGKMFCYSCGIEELLKISTYVKNNGGKRDDSKM